MFRPVTSVVVGLTLTACVSQPDPYSLEGIQAQARREAFGRCISTTLHENRHVPTFAVWQACEQLIHRRRRR